jgi:hypothetical protein
MEMSQISDLVSNIGVSIPQSPQGAQAAILPPADVLCMPMITGSSTGTQLAVGGSANNCLDI